MAVSRNEFNRAVVIDENFRRTVGESRPSTDGDANLGTLSAEKLLDLFHSQLVSRHLDLVARRLRAKNQGYYTIGSSGHEGNVVLGDLTRHTDPAYLHYRSGALFIQRSKQLPEQNAVRDVLLGMVASSEDPISGGRHKVWGSKELWVLPQTSTIASHIPKAVGAATMLRRAKRRGWHLPVPEDSIVVCSFGDASANHAAALAGLNAARWLSYQKIPVPILFVCEDNRIGISVRTPPQWLEEREGNHPVGSYFFADGLNLPECYEVSARAVEQCRTRREPVFLHLNMVRLMGHAGSDMELEYRSLEDVEATEAQDPLIRTAKLIVDADVLSPEEVLEQYQQIGSMIDDVAADVVQRPKLTTLGEVISPLAPLHLDDVHADAKRALADDVRREIYADAGSLPEYAPAKHLAVQLNFALREMLAKYPESLILGEDVGKKGGVYHVTANLLEHFGPSRVFDTLLDETSILGMGMGAAQMGALAIPEIQYLAYFHNACDQIRGEAASMQYYSLGQFKNPMLIRIASFSYQQGIGGHFHNDNTIAPIRDIPGVIVIAPARGDDAVELMRTAAALAHVDGRVVFFLEPIALYMVKDLYEPKDGKWQTNFPPPGRIAPFGEPRIYDPQAKDLTIITFGNGTYVSLRAAKRLADVYRLRARVVDLRWLHPLNEQMICEQAKATGKVLIVDETRRSGGLSEAIITALIEGGCQNVKISRLTAADTFIPLGPAAFHVLPTEDDIVNAAMKLC